jgi:hypothetical protein
MKDPFKPTVIELRVPVEAKELKVTQLTLQPPTLKDLVATDGDEYGSHGADVSLLSSLSGIPQIALEKLVPEDWADIRVVLAQTYNRFFGIENLLDKKDAGKEEGDAENPTTAGSPSAT